MKKFCLKLNERMNSIKNKLKKKKKVCVKSFDVLDKLNVGK